jgi:hypothetical protein
VAPPGKSLHRLGTELDLGPPGAYGWLAVNAHRFGFVQRYGWEKWHYELALATNDPRGRDNSGDGCCFTRERQDLSVASGATALWRGCCANPVERLRRFRGIVLGGWVGCCLGRGGSERVAVELEEVVGGGDKTPFRAGGGSAAA